MDKKDFLKLITSYKKKFSEKKLNNVLLNQSSKLGSKLIYTALLMFYAFKRNETPVWAKNIILGSLGYLISPIDLLPDLTPVLGYTDDLGVLSFGIVTIASYINDETKDKAKEKITQWFPGWKKETVISIDDKL